MARRSLHHRTRCRQFTEASNLGQTPRSICSPRRQSDLGGRVPIHMDFICCRRGYRRRDPGDRRTDSQLCRRIGFGRSAMADIVDIAIPAKAQAAAEALGLVVSRSVTDGCGCAVRCAENQDRNRLPARLWLRCSDRGGQHAERPACAARLITGRLACPSIHRELHEQKKDRAWFVSQQLGELVSQHYPNDELAARALRTDPKSAGADSPGDAREKITDLAEIATALCRPESDWRADR